MPFVTMESANNKIDGSIKNRVFDFLHKLQVDDTAPGLHIEPMVNPRDKRVRTGRVTKEWRAVLFRVDSPAGTNYVYHGTWHHDEAIRIARSRKLKFNLALGVPEVEDFGLPDAVPNNSDTAEATPAPEVTKTSEVTESVEETEPPEVPEPSSSIEGETSAGTIQTAWTNYLPGRWTTESLRDEAGIHESAAEQALEAETLADLNAIIDRLPEAQGLVLLGLANGEDLDAVREELGLTPAVDTTVDEDEAIDRALRASAPGFVFVGENPDELRQAIESLDIERWRVFLHPEQRRYVEGRWKGSYRLSGGAGTGKTVVLLHRTRALFREQPTSRILLTTYTKTLAAALVRQLKRLDADLPIAAGDEPGVSVLGLDQVAAKALNKASAAEVEAAQRLVLGPGRNALSQRSMNSAQLWKAAVEASDPDLTPELTETAFLEQEYLSVVLALRIVDEKGYLRASRQGRGTALNRAARKELWKVFAQFRRTQQMSDSATFPEVATIAAVILEQRAERGVRGPYDHVLVDEAQDFHAAHWQLLRALAPEGPDDLFIAEDSHQRIYGQKVPLSRYGIQIRGRSRRLRLNYRTTAENLAYAITLLQGGDYTDLENEAEDSTGYRSVRSGPVPEVVSVGNLAQEVEVAAGRVRDWVSGGVAAEAVAVLVRADQAAKRVAAALDAEGVKNAYVSRGETAGKGKVSVMTMHSAKGMEFERVVVVGGDAVQFESALGVDRLPEAEQADARLRDRSLLYVAATRARDQLVVTASGSLVGGATHAR